MAYSRIADALNSIDCNACECVYFHCVHLNDSSKKKRRKKKENNVQIYIYINTVRHCKNKRKIIIDDTKYAKKSVFNWNSASGCLESGKRPT